MRKLVQQLEEMHIRIAETATHEEALVKALGDALARLDDQLLHDVQSIATEHEARRTAILGELQGLAGSIGMFQVARPAITARENLESEVAAYIPSAGDWREATNNIHDDESAPPQAALRPQFVQEQRPHAHTAAPLSLLERRRRMTG